MMSGQPARPTGIALRILNISPAVRQVGHEKTWDRIFKDPVTTATAIDRLVHHCTIMGLTGQSYRAQAAKSRGAGDNYRGGNDGESSLDSATPNQDINQTHAQV